MNFQLYISPSMLDLDHKVGIMVFETNNVMQAECAFTRYAEKITDKSSPLVFRKTVTLVHKDMIRRERAYSTI